MSAMTSFPANRDMRDGGFTLIELLVSLVLLSMILLALPAALNVARRTKDISKDLDRASQDRSALAYVEQSLLQTMPLYRRGDNGLLRIYFDGGPESVSFVAPSAVGPLGGGLYQFELKSRNLTDDTTGLVLNWSLYPSEAKDSSKPESAGERILLENISSFHLSYFGLRKDAPQPDWGDSWQRPDILPDLIEILINSNSPASPKQFRLLVDLKLKPSQ
jgi:prepilin-type N-terminal cleavage/methylation domain-containing protein